MDVAEELKAFLVESDGITKEAGDQRVLCVYNNAPDVRKLPYVDLPTNKVEWIISVSMLSEGWDVKRVFQIVPHEERAFNSKLLIAQVLGRGLRIPIGFESGPQPEVTVFNHDAWAQRIKNLVNEVLEIEKRLSSQVLDDSPHHFDLHNIDYTLEATSVKKPMSGPYNLFEKGYVDLAADVTAEAVSAVFVKAATGEEYKWQTMVRHRTYTADEVAQVMYDRLDEADNPDESPPDPTYRYTDNFPLERLQEIVRKSLELRGMTVATERVRQRLLQSLGTLRRTASENVRYTFNPNSLKSLSTRDRQAASVSAAELRRDKFYFYTDHTSLSLKDEQDEFFTEATEPGSGFKVVLVNNRLDFKTPLNAVIADSEPERRFVNMLLDPMNLTHIDAWIKSVATGFYEIEFAWKKREHPKRGKFNPDFFLKAGERILVVEIKYEEEIIEPSDENRMKHKYAREHFARVNNQLEEAGSALHYQFNFLTPSNFGAFFAYLRNGDIAAFQSELDIKLLEDN
jgi:type III restriction enzyme